MDTDYTEAPSADSETTSVGYKVSAEDMAAPIIYDLIEEFPDRDVELALANIAKHTMTPKQYGMSLCGKRYKKRK